MIAKNFGGIKYLVSEGYFEDDENYHVNCCALSGNQSNGVDIVVNGIMIKLSAKDIFHAFIEPNVKQLADAKEV